MNRLRPLIAALAAFCAMRAPSVAGDDGFRMNYRFPRQGTLSYLIERQDSLFLPGDAQRKAAVSYFRITQTLKPLDDNQDGFRISLSTDSLWKGPDNQSPINQYEKMLFGSEFSASEEKFEIDSRGESPSKRRRFIPFLLPLPGEAVSVDAAWDFSLETPFQKPFKGHILTSGDCQVYRIQKEAGDSLAILAMRIEKSNSAEMSIKEPYQTFTNLYETSDAGVGALYFNVSRGRMEKGVIQWSGSVHAQESGKERVYIRKSRLTFRLLPAE
jgi:hypothetical protein